MPPLDFRRLTAFPLADRASLTRTDDILLPLDAPLPPCSADMANRVAACAAHMRTARERKASVMLIYGAHLLRNGTALLLDRLMRDGWLTHLATNGAGTIHDWEYAWLGASTESVARGVHEGNFGTWHETATYIHMAILTGLLDGFGYGHALGRFIAEDGCTLPSVAELTQQITCEPQHPLTVARADLLQTILAQGWPSGRVTVMHRWQQASILASAYRHGVGMSVHPGIGYDIIANHSVFSGAAIGRAAELDFKLFGGAVENLDGGVVLSIGSAIMGPQVFEKSISCVHNLRHHDGRPNVQGHAIYVVDLQDGGGWDWTQGEPPKTNPAYYLRFCKSYSRMGGQMQYIQADNAAFVQHLYHELVR